MVNAVADLARAVPLPPFALALNLGLAAQVAAALVPDIARGWCPWVDGKSDGRVIVLQDADMALQSTVSRCYA